MSKKSICFTHEEWVSYLYRLAELKGAYVVEPDALASSFVNLRRIDDWEESSAEFELGLELSLSEEL